MEQRRHMKIVKRTVLQGDCMTNHEYKISYFLLCVRNDMYISHNYLPEVLSLRRKLSVKEYKVLLLPLYNNTLGEATSKNLWPRYDRHFVGIT